MEIIQKILNIETLSYSSNLSQENIKEKVEKLFEQSAIRLAGKITSQNEFTAYDKLIVIGWDMPYLRRKSAYLKGRITQEAKGTLIKLKVNPNSILPIFAILATISGIIIVLMTLLNADNDKQFFIIGFIFITLGLVYYPLSTLLRNRLRNKIVKHLGLTRI